MAVDEIFILAFLAWALLAMLVSSIAWFRYDYLKVQYRDPEAYLMRMIEWCCKDVKPLPKEVDWEEFERRIEKRLGDGDWPDWYLIYQVMNKMKVEPIPEYKKHFFGHEDTTQSSYW